MKSILKQDLLRNFPNGIGSALNVFSSPGIISVFIYRYNHFVTERIRPKILRLPMLVIGLLVQKIYGDFYGIHISRHARFGGGLKISHFGGIFVNDRVVGGENVTICKGVSIGISGSGDHQGAPTIGNAVYIGQNTIVHGPITIGSNVKIGPNTTVFFDVPDNSAVLAARPEVRTRPSKAQK